VTVPPAAPIVAFTVPAQAALGLAGELGVADATCDGVGDGEAVLTGVGLGFGDGDAIDPFGAIGWTGVPPPPPQPATIAAATTRAKPAGAFPGNAARTRANASTKPDISKISERGG
jgi:hypothetical protein